MKNAFEELGLTADATEAQVKAAWKRLAQLHHPDKGGDGAEYTRLSLMYRQAVKICRTGARKCKLCKGAGYTRKFNGFGSVQVRCHHCRGTGKQL